MKPNDFQSTDESLVDAVLNDDTWRSHSANAKAQVLEAFRAYQRQRFVSRLGTAALAVSLLVGIAFVRNLPNGPASQGASATAIQPAAVASAPSLNDEQLLSLFPKGSCFLAEVDGRKQLVFMDQAAEAVYLAKSDRKAN